MGVYVTVHEIPDDSGAAFLSVEAEGFPDEDGLMTRYTIRDETRKDGNIFGVLFQEGHPSERGMNGITEEALLAVLMDRLADRQNNGAVKCEKNKQALDHLRFAMKCLVHAEHNKGLLCPVEEIRYPVNTAGKVPTMEEAMAPLPEEELAPMLRQVPIQVTER